MHHVTALHAKPHTCLAVTSCHLHLWQNDRELLRATAVTRGWNGYGNKSQHRKLTLEKKILPSLLPGHIPPCSQHRVHMLVSWKTGEKGGIFYDIASNTCRQFIYLKLWQCVRFRRTCGSSKLIIKRPSVSVSGESNRERTELLTVWTQTECAAGRFHAFSTADWFATKHSREFRFHVFSSFYGWFICNEIQHSRLLYHLIREIKRWLNINHITVHNNTYFIF